MTNDETKQDMQDMTERLKSWEKDVADKKLTAIAYAIAEMKKIDIKCVVCEYSGEGDSGEITEVYVLTQPVEPDDFHNEIHQTPGIVDNDGVAVLKETKVDLDHPLWGNTWSKVENLLDALSCCAHYVTPSGYEINDGGQGTIVFDAINNECRCEHGSNYTETNYESVTISLDGESDAEVQS